MRWRNRWSYRYHAENLAQETAAARRIEDKREEALRSAGEDWDDQIRRRMEAGLDHASNQRRTRRQRTQEPSAPEVIWGVPQAGAGRSRQRRAS